MPLGDVINFRFDPFTETYNPTDITDEAHTIPANTPYYVRLSEVPKEDSPSTVSVYDVTAGAGMTEVSGVPGDNEFRVDYKYQTGYIQFNAADANHSIQVTYKGIGDRILGKLWNDRFDLYKAHKHDQANEDQIITFAHWRRTLDGIASSGVGGGPDNFVDVSGVTYEYDIPDDDSHKVYLMIQFGSIYVEETSHLRFRIGASNFSSEETVVGVNWVEKTVGIIIDDSWRGTTQTLQIQMWNNFGPNRCKTRGGTDLIKIYCG